jgi:sugar diacid utilization regulator
MPNVTELVASTARLGLTLLAGPAEGRTIHEVAAVESLDGVSGAQRGSLLVVMQAASTAALPYELDVAIRQAANLQLAALILAGRDHLPITSARLAERARLPVLTVAPGRDVADLVLRIDRVIRGGAADALARAESAMQALREAEGHGDITALLAAVSEALGCQLALDEDPSPGTPADGYGVVSLHGRAIAQIRTDHRDVAAGLVLPAVTAAVSRLRQNELDRRFAPTQTRAELLTQMLVADRNELVALADQARNLGLPIHDIHVAAWIQVNQAEQTSTENLVQQRRLLDSAALIALETLHAGHGLWHVARLGASVLVVLCTDRAGGLGLTDRVRRDVERVIAAILEHDDTTLYVGMGTPQRGAEGIRQSAMEARAAAGSAETGSRHGAVTTFDSSGLRRILADLYSSPLNRRMIAELLAPLDALGRTRSRQAIETLAAFLDAQGSPTRAARDLHLHPNAVSYRVRHIVQTLDIDLSDADMRFALHLACRARLLDR